MVGSLMGWLPAMAALLTVIWTAIRIYETDTVQKGLSKAALYFLKKHSPVTVVTSTSPAVEVQAQSPAPVVVVTIPEKESTNA